MRQHTVNVSNLNVQYRRIGVRKELEPLKSQIGKAVGGNPSFRIFKSLFLRLPEVEDFIHSPSTGMLQ